MDNITDEQLDKLLDKLLARLEERTEGAFILGTLDEPAKPKPQQHRAFYTRHGQVAIVEFIQSDDIGRGYIIGDSTEHHVRKWYATGNKHMPFITEANLPSGEDLFIEPPDDPTEWSREGNINAKERLP